MGQNFIFTSCQCREKQSHFQGAVPLALTEPKRTEPAGSADIDEGETPVNDVSQHREYRQFFEVRRTCRVQAGTLASACLIAMLVFLCAVVPAALADEEGDVPGQPYPLFSTEEAAGQSDNLIDQLIDTQAAKELPHSDLDRSEASDLIEGVFGSLLGGSAGPFGDLHIDHFLADNVAVISPAQPDGAVTIGGEKAAEEEAEKANGPLLLDSTLPLRTENDAGQDRVVDLNLEHDEGELQAANPLVEVGIPDELGKGIELPSGGLELEIGASAEERAPSILSGNVAFYPNVAQDTDFAVATTPTGVETFTQIRSADAPQSQTLQFDLGGAALENTLDGGAIAMSGTEEVLEVMKPTAVDAAGNEVPVSLEVSGDSIVLNAATDESTAFPVLLDPVIIESWPWNEKSTSNGMDGGNGTGTGDWRSWRNTNAFSATYNVPWSTPPGPLKMWMPGLTVTTGYSGTVSVGSQANWNYYVPRYFSDYSETSKRPTSFIQNMQMWNLVYAAYSKQGSPWMAVGLWDEEQSKWVSYVTRNGAEGSLENFSYLYNFPNPTYVRTAKNAGAGLLSSEAGANNGRILYIGYAALSLNDLDFPSGSVTGSTQWIDSATTAPLTFSFEDTGLGVYSVTLSDRQTPQHTWTTSMACTGVASNPCPRKISSPGTKLTFAPSVLPQGVNTLDVKVSDPLENVSTSTATVKVDHTDPTVTLGGSVTEQATLGKSRPTYTVKLEAVDGTSGSPQSGVAATSIRLDGKAVDMTSSGCATQNCSVSRTWTLESLKYAPGTHLIEVSATDAVGRSTTKKITIELQRDETSPSLNLSGNLKSAPGGWIAQPNTYEVSAVSTDGGFGSTALRFEIDKKVIGQAKQVCSQGGCALNHTFAINADSHGGGAHEAAIVAEDGAENIKRSSWTFKVNVDGVPGATEVPSMANALIEGAGNPSPSSSIEGFPYEPSTTPEASEEALSIAGSGARGGVSLIASDGFNVAGLSGLPFVMAPIGAGAVEGQTVVGGDAVSYPGVWAGIDMMVRPIRDGMSDYVLVHQDAALRSLKWEIIGANPVSLAKQAGGGVSVSITPSSEVRTFDGKEEEEKLSGATQQVATIAPPRVIDGSGKSLPVSLEVESNTVAVKLTATEAVYPVNLELGVHIEGPLATWNPVSETKTETPSEVPVTTVGITNQAGPVGAEWFSNATGTEVTEVRPDAQRSLVYHSIPISKNYETWIVQPPIEQYAPTSEATASCFIGFCAGNILCSAVGPQRPFGPPVQTYAVLKCGVQGDQPKDFQYEEGGACLQRRYGVNGQPLWVNEKCRNTLPHTGNPNWEAVKEAAEGCSNGGVWRGEAWVTVVTARAVSTTGSPTSENFKC